MTTQREIEVQTPPCIVCHETSRVKLTEVEFHAVQEGVLHIQDALPNRDADFRELIQSGIHPECWDSMFEEEDQD